MEGSELHLLSKFIELVSSPWTAMFQILGCLRIKISALHLGTADFMFEILC